MTATTVRAALPYPVDGDPNDVSTHVHNLAQAVDDKFPLSGQGLLSARPATPHQRELYYATNDRGGKLFYGDGASWKEVGPSPVAGPVTGFSGLITAPSTALDSDTVLGIRGKATQTGALQRWQSSTGTTYAQVTANGTFSLGAANLEVGTGKSVSTEALIDTSGVHAIDLRNVGPPRLITDIGAGAGWGVRNNVTSLPGFIVENPAGQTAVMQKWQVNGADLIVFTANGRIGVGTTTPAATVEIRGAPAVAFVNANLRLSRLTPATDPQSLSFSGGVTGYDYLIGRIPGSDDLVFDVWNGVTLSERARISLAGKISAVSDIEATGMLLGAEGRMGAGALGAGAYVSADDNGAAEARLRAISSATNADLTLAGQGTGRVIIPAPAWTNATLQNGWVSYDAGVVYWVPRYAKNAEGSVSLDGLAKHATPGQLGTVFTLPVGYRPVKREPFVVSALGELGEEGAARIDVLPNGTVVVVSYIAGGSAGYLGFTSIQFATN